MDQAGKVSDFSLPVIDKGGKDIFTDPAYGVRVDQYGNQEKVYAGGKSQSIITWGLDDGSTLTPFKDKNGYLHIGKTEKDSNPNYVYTVKTQNMLGRNFQDYER